MQPGYPGSGQDPYNQQPPSDPFGGPGYGQYPQQPDPYNPAPASGTPYQDPYNPGGYQQPTSGQPYDPSGQQPYNPGGQPPYDPSGQQPYNPGGQLPYYPQPEPVQPVTGYPQPGYDPNYPQGYQAPVVYPGATGYTVPGAAPAGGQSNTLGLLSMIFGIISIPLAFCCLYIGIPLGIAAIILGFLGMNKAKLGQASNRGMALAGVICGGAGVLLAVVWIILVFALHIGSSYP